MHKSEIDYATGVYKCTDSIKNFKIRIRLQQEKSSFIPLPEFQLDSSPEARTHVGNNSSDAETRVFSWQEKVFSPMEISRYQNSANCITPLEEKYHNDVTELCQRGIPNNRMYSVTSADDFTDMDEGNLSVTSEAKPTMTNLLQGVSELRQRQKVGGHRKLHRSKQTLCPRREIVDYHPSEEAMRKNHLLDSFPLVMYILADLSIREEDSLKVWYGKSEYVLCTIRHDPATGTLTVAPDFSRIDGLTPGNPTAEPYLIEVDGDARNVYEYWIEHASRDITLEEREREAEVGNKLRSHQAELHVLQTGTDFSMPRAGVLRVHVLGEIRAARLFELDDLFVHFFVQLPPGWRSDSELDGVTHRCRTQGAGVANFGHTFEMMLEMELEEMSRDAEWMPHWPQLFVEVVSLDSWSRHRTEGYGYVTLPPSPGDHDVTVSTWRPLSAGPVGEMRRFFVGGSPELEDPAYVAVPTTNKGARLSKYGVRTISSGEVDVRLCVVHQSRGSAGARPGGASFLLERLSAATLVTSVNNALKAFRQARDRMLAAKQGLDLTD